MRYEDASHTDSFQGSGPIANDDADTLTAGARAPATGNVITGEGTQYGAAGADSAAGAHITAIAGSGGEDSSFAGGKLGVSGQFGSLSMDANGNYSYVAHKDAPENVRDRFTYTLADNQGGTDTAALIVEIGKTPVVIKANATQIVPGPDGVVTLPPGVELSDVMVVGRNLVVNMPDGTQLIIVDGAVFVPQLVLGGVEVPATNVAALLIGQEPQPAAGELPPSSGGNFAVPPPPLDPGVPLGDLIPPTVYTYVPPEPQEVFPEINDEEPEIFIQPDGQPASVNAVDSVDEKGLPARNGGEPQGSGEEAAAGANGDPSEATAGTIIIDSPDGVDSVSINGVLVTGAIGQQIAGAFGTLTITGFSGQNILYSYLLNDNTSGNNTHDDFSVTLTDGDGDQASATLVISIIDDVPTARNDTDASVNGVATGNVMTDAAAGDIGDSDTNAADTVGADNATLTAVSGTGGSDSTFSGGFLNVNGSFGSLAIDAQGNYTYTVNPEVGGGGVDVFTYTLTDGDGDTTTATLTITNPDLKPDLPDPATIHLDDDVIPGANGNVPDGVGDEDPDVVGQNSANGVLAGTGGDGDLDYAFTGTNTLPAGFTVNPVNASTVQILQGGTVVLTVTLNNETGAFTVVQNAPIDHPAGSDENNLSFGVGVQVVDVDGDVEPATITINVDDDTPTIGRADVSIPAIEVDETNLALNNSANFSVVFNGQYGADGPGTTSYALNVVNGTDSGLVDVGTGLPVLLYNIGGVVTGSTSATLAGVTAGNTVFTVSVDSGTGVVTLDQIRALDHPVNPDPNDPVSPNATSIQLVATITDGDGDPASLSVNIGAQLSFRDDGPTVDISLSAVGEPSLVTQDSETDGVPTSQDSASASFAANFTVNANGGADGLGSQTVTYALGVSAPGVDSGLDSGGASIFLYNIGGVVVGSTSATQAGVNAGNTVFNVTVAANGTVTLTQFSQIDHPIAGDPSATGAPFVDHVATLTDSLVTLTATASVTDGDGDPASDSQVLNIGAQLQFQDDGPDISAVLTGTQIRIDETDGVAAAGGEVDPVGGNLGTVTLSAATLFTVSNVNVSADTPTTLGYGLVLSGQGVASGLLLSTTNAPIFLYDLGGGVVAGSTSATLAGVNAGNTAFTVSINPGTGAVTMTQFLAVEHFNTGSFDEDSSGLNAGALSVQVTATDFDGDTDQANVDLGSVIRFEDDGPSIDVSVSTQFPEPTLLTQDAETDGVPTSQDSASSSINFGGMFNLTSNGGSDGAASAPVLSYQLGISAPGVDSGLDSSGASIFLYTIGGVVVGSTSATQAGVNAGNTVFDVSVSGTGVVTLTQYSQIDHPIGGDPTATGAPFADHILSMTDSLVTLTASSTITDNDGDQATDSATINIGANLQFADDGPDISAVLTGNQIRIDETDGVAAAGGEVDPVGGNLGTVTVSAATLFTVGNVNVSADTPTTLGYALSLSSQGVDSGLDVSSNNASIFLYNIGGQVVGSTSATQAGVNAGNTAFTVSINSTTGAVTLTQFLAIEHPTPGASHDEDSSALAAGVLNVTVTATDFDGDTDQASVDLGSVIRFEDDGPTAQNDVDSIVGGNGPATGNVLTGVEVAVAEDGNATDGVADSVGSDTPGSITFIDHSNAAPGVAVPAGGSVNILGDHGTLTIYSNGDYSYLRTDAVGGVSDVFTYTLTDADGDTTTATLTIGIQDNFPVLPDPATILLDDDVIPGAGGNLDGPGDDNPDAVPGNVVNGTLVGSGGDAPLTYNFTGVNTLPSGFSIGAGSDADTLLINQGGTLVMTIQLNQSTGAFTVTQNAPMLHPADNGGPDDNIENNLNFSIGVNVEDADHDVEPATITINVDDDTPTIDVTKGSDAAVILTTDDAQTIGGASDTAVSTANFSGVFGLNQSAGADGTAAAATLNYALDVTGFAGGPGGVDSGLDQGGNSIFLYEIGGKVVGSTSATLAGVTAGNTVFDVGVSATGVVTLTQYSQIDHPIGSDPSATGSPFADHIVSLTDNLVTLTASASLTDNDGDNVTDSEVVNIGANLRFTDDGPSAAIVEAAQAVILDESVGIQADSKDTTNAGVIALFAGVTNTGTDTDLPQYAQSTAALVASTGSAYGADGAGTTLFSLNVSSAGVDSGLNTTGGQDILLFKEGSLIVGRVSGGPDNGKAALAIAIDPVTGLVSTVEYLSIQHPNAANPDDSVSIADGAVLAVVTVTDFDGDTATSQVGIGSQIQFQDSAPVMTSASNINIQNSGDVAHTGAFAFNLGADGANITTNDVITNVTGSATVGGVAVQNWTLTPGAETANTASYSFSFDYPIGGGNTAHETGTLVFDKVAGTYTVDLANPIQGVTTILQTSQGTLFQGYEFGSSTVDGSQPEISVTQIQDLAGTANDIYVQFTSVAEPSSGTGDNNLEVSNWVPGADNPAPIASGGDTSWSAGQLFNQVDSWVSTSNSANGVAGDTIQGGEVLDFSLVQGANPTGNLAQPATFAQASAMFLKFDGIGASEDMIVVLKLYDPNTNTYTTRAIMVENGDIIHGPGAGPGQYSGVTLDNNDGLVIIESNDYNLPGENWVIVGAQVAGSDEGITGTAINLNGAIGAAGDSVTGAAFDLDAAGFQSDTDDGPFKISSIGFLTTSTTPQNAQLDFNVTVTDGDGDSITQAITATVTPAVDSSTPIALGAAVTTISAEPLTTKTSSSSLLTHDVQEQQVQKVAANSNTLTMATAVAAAGVVESAAAAQPHYAQMSLDNMVHQTFQTVNLGGDSRVALDSSVSRLALGNETMQFASDSAPHSSGFHFNAQSFEGGHMLDGLSANHAAPAYSPSVMASQGPVNVAAAMPVAPTVAMVSAQALQAGSLSGDAGHGGSIGHIVAEALGHGGAPATVDAILDAFHGGGGELGAIANLASPTTSGVPAWDMTMHGAFGTGFDMMMKMGAEMLHHDAVQPVQNG